MKKYLIVLAALPIFLTTAVATGQEAGSAGRLTGLDAQIAAHERCITELDQEIENLSGQKQKIIEQIAALEKKPAADRKPAVLKQQADPGAQRSFELEQKEKQQQLKKEEERQREVVRQERLSQQKERARSAAAAEKNRLEKEKQRADSRRERIRVREQKRAERENERKNQPRIRQVQEKQREAGRQAQEDSLLQARQKQMESSLQLKEEEARVQRLKDEAAVLEQEQARLQRQSAVKGYAAQIRQDWVEEDKGRISPQVYQQGIDNGAAPAVPAPVRPSSPSPYIQSRLIEESPFAGEPPQPAVRQGDRVQRKKKVESALDQADAWLERNLW